MQGPLQGRPRGGVPRLLHDWPDPRWCRVSHAGDGLYRLVAAPGRIYRQLHLSPFGLILLLTGFFIVLGCLIDGISMVVLTMAVLLPTVQAAGLDLIWFGIFIVLVVEMAHITPPVGFDLFVIQGLTNKEITYIARTAFPLFVLMMLAVLGTYFFEDIVLWLPRQMS